MTPKQSLHQPVFRLKATAMAVMFALSPLALSSAYAQTAPAPSAKPVTPADAKKGDEKVESLVITGTRMQAASLTATSPVSQFSAADIAMVRAITVEDFSTKLPQLAGGVNSTSAGSDAFGAQTLDLRNLGQSRTLVLINGTRAVPFSFRNAVDVNSIPAPLIQRVDILTGGAAAVYGADAISGVVNFIMNDRFRGLQTSANYRGAKGGGSQYGANVTFGSEFADRGSVVGYAEYTERKELLAGKRDWALRNPGLVAGSGGNFTDVASGRIFSVDDANRFTLTPQTTDYTPGYLLIQPMKRVNASTFFKYDFTDAVQGYGRVMYSNVKTTGAPRSGQVPVVVNTVVGITSANSFIPPEARPLLTFVNGVAQVRVNRSLGELGVKTAENDRTTFQAQVGLKGSFTDAVSWDVYAQTGTSKESIVVNGDGVAARFPTLVNTIDIFGPGADLSGLAQQFKYGDRERKQNVIGANVSGDSRDLFKLPAGPIGFALGAENRRETGTFDYNPNLGQSFNQGVESGPGVPPFFRAREVYGEVLIPLLSDLPLIKNLSIEGAKRRSAYTKSVGASNTYDTDKFGASWSISDDFRLRATRQNVVREPNFGEFANPVFSIPFSSLVTVARLRPRYAGDPCVLGTGNAEQCRRFNAPAVGSYNSLDAANLLGGYFFGGNPDIRAEKGKTSTLGAVLTPTSLKDLSLAVDYYRIEIKDAVGQIQPIDALTSCYITDPSAGNPLCQAVTRNPTTGRIQDGFPVDRNLALIKQEGFDLDLSFRHRVLGGLPGRILKWQYQGAFVRKYTIQRNAVLDPIDCKGTYGSRCSSDAVSLVAPSYRHRASVTWEASMLTAQIGWKRIGKVNDSTFGSTGSISAQDYFDLNIAWRTPVKGLSVNAGIDNIADKKPPTPTNPSTFNTFADTYNVLGRSLGFTATYKFN
ncbi:MAG: TonB-dependent receptor plug domain-containing protein [Rhodocyclaceae bacterium]|nr:TonB-dependent receptor plug domain-containing protein [Rhodocyclaceae bacterium]